MLNRRQFVSAVAASAAMFRAPRAFAAAARYDLIIRAGRVIDPSVRLNAVRDVAISEGRIVAVEANIAGDAADTIDARGKLVVPGLLDIHTHTGRSAEGPWARAAGRRDRVDRCGIARGRPHRRHRGRRAVIAPAGPRC